MASFEELQQQAKQKANLAKQSQVKSQEEIDKKFNRKKIQLDNSNNFKVKNDSELESVKKKQSFSANAFRSAVNSLRKQFEDAQNNPDSIFAPFFEKDKNGNVINKINYKTVLDKENGIDEFLNSKKELEEIKPVVKRIRTRKDKIESIIVKDKKVKEELYKNTSEYKKEAKEKEKKYLTDKYVKKGNYVSELFYDIKNDKYDRGYLPVPYENENILVLEDPDKIDEVKKLINSKIEDNINLEKQTLGLDIVKEGFDMVSKFQEERLSVLRDLRDIENQSIDFTNKLFDIEEVRKYYGSKDSMNTDFFNKNFSDNFFIIKTFLNNYRENEKKILDLSPIKKCIEDQRVYMNKFSELKDKHPDKISEYFKSNKKDELYKEIVGKKMPSRYLYQNEFYPREVSFGESKKNISLNKIKEIYDYETEKLNKKNEVVKSFAESSFDLSVKTWKIREIYNNDPSSLEYILKKSKETEINLSDYLQLNIKYIEKTYKNKLNEIIIFSSYPLMFESDQKSIDSFEVSVQNAKNLINEKQKYIRSLRNKKLGFFDSKSKHMKLLQDQEEELRVLEQELETKKNDLSNKKYNIGKSENNRIIERLFYDEYKIYDGFISKNLSSIKHTLTLNEILNKFKEIIESKLLEIRNKKEENDNLEKDLKEYQNLAKKLKEEKEKVYSFYKDSIKDKK